jgi:hypothetical protein
MKITTNKNMSLRIFNRAPINFWEYVAVDENSTTKNEDTICHKVKHDPADKGSDMYKKYMKPFSHGMPEQWLKFKEAHNVVIRGNGLNENGCAHFNLMCSSLKGEALCIFNDEAAKQKEEMEDAHIKCLHAIMEHIFPKDNPLQKQKTYMCHHMFLHFIKMTDKSVSFPPGGSKSTTGSTNSHHSSPINTFWMIKLRTSFTTSFRSIGSLTFNVRISST